MTKLEGYDTAQVCLNGHMINSMAADFCFSAHLYRTHLGKLAS